MPSSLTLMLFSATILVIQAGCIVWWSSRSNLGEQILVQQWVSIALIVVQLAVFGLSAFTTGVSVVSNATMDAITYNQIVLMGTVLISAVGWMFFGHRVQKFLRPV